MVVFSNPPPAYSPDSDDMPIENIIYRSKLNLIPPSKIEVYDRNHVPQDLQGALTIVIDVLAATSNIGDFLNAGANLLLTDDSTILDAMKRMPEALIIGETLNNELRPKIPFYSWHPPHILQRDQVLKQLEGKDLLYLTNNGTKVVHEVSAANPAQVITSSFPYLGSTIRYAQGAFEANNVERIVIVSSGEIQHADSTTGEDALCAIALKELLSCGTHDLKATLQSVAEYIHRKYVNNLYQFDSIDSDLAIVCAVDRLDRMVPRCSPMSDGSGLFKVTNCWQEIA